MQSLLPRETLSREKVGFRVPVDEWFRNDLREFVWDHICNSASRIARFIDINRVKDIVASHQDGTRNCEKQIWALLNLEIFLQAFNL